MQKGGISIAYVTIPKDLSQVKTKFLFNLTKRQVICFGCGILAGLPLFFILRGVMPASAAALIMIVVMMPFFLFAMYEQHGQPLEVVLKHIIESRFQRPRIRLYETDNFYAAIDRDVRMKKEVNLILHGKEKAKAKTHQGGKEAAERADGKEPARQETAPDNSGNYPV